MPLLLHRGVRILITACLLECSVFRITPKFDFGRYSYYFGLTSHCLGLCSYNVGLFSYCILLYSSRNMTKSVSLKLSRTLDDSARGQHRRILINKLRPRQDGRHFPDDTFKRISLNENVWISIEISLKFVRKGSINNIPALVLIMAWRRPGDKPLSEAMMVSLLTHICVTRP